MFELLKIIAVGVKCVNLYSGEEWSRFYEKKPYNFYDNIINFIPTKGPSGSGVITRVFLC